MNTFFRKSVSIVWWMSDQLHSTAVVVAQTSAIKAVYAPFLLAMVLIPHLSEARSFDTSTKEHEFLCGFCLLRVCTTQEVAALELGGWHVFDLAPERKEGSSQVETKVSQALNAGHPDPKQVGAPSAKNRPDSSSNDRRDKFSLHIWLPVAEGLFCFAVGFVLATLLWFFLSML